jgi:RNA polymerase sigma-70 factor (ECF subfamily)
MNQNEFIQLINPFKDKVFRLAKRLLVSTEEAEDATQEVLVKLWNKKTAFDTYNSVEAVAMTMTKNYCLDQLKSKRASNIQLVHSNYSSGDSGIDQITEDRDSLNWVEKLIRKLPQQQQIILHLREVEQYEFSEIATQLEMNETAVRVALSRGRKTLKQLMLKTHEHGLKSN